MESHFQQNDLEVRRVKCENRILKSESTIAFFLKKYEVSIVVNSGETKQYEIVRVW